MQCLARTSPRTPDPPSHRTGISSVHVPDPTARLPGRLPRWRKDKPIPASVLSQTHAILSITRKEHPGQQQRQAPASSPSPPSPSCLLLLAFGTRAFPRPKCPWGLFLNRALAPNRPRCPRTSAPVRPGLPLPAQTPAVALQARAGEPVTCGRVRAWLPSKALGSPWFPWFSPGRSGGSDGVCRRPVRLSPS